MDKRVPSAVNHMTVVQTLKREQQHAKLRRLFKKKILNLKKGCILVNER